MAKGEAFYTAYKEADKMAYQAMFGRQQPMDFFGIPMGPAESKQIITAMVDKEIKVAGNNTGKRVFDALMRTNSDFRRDARKLLNSVDAQDFKRMRSPFMSDYELFNGVALLDRNSSGLQKTFYAKLKELGYGAVADVNDRKYSGYNTASAIVFDRANIGKPSASLLTDGQIQIAEGKNFARQIGDILRSPYAAVVGSGAALAATSNIADKRNAKKYGNKDSK